MANKCADYIRDLNDYLDGTIDLGLCHEIEEHVGHCDNCRIMIDTMKQTVILCRDGIKEKLPETLELKLKSALKTRWEEHFRKK
jgi:predicted anti-sigma-YlaC factor YlaD